MRPPLTRRGVVDNGVATYELPGAREQVPRSVQTKPRKINEVSSNFALIHQKNLATLGHSLVEHGQAAYRQSVEV